jgi:non-homologous end joining protein Ku
MEPEKAQNNKIEIEIVNLSRLIMLAEELNSDQVVDSFLNKPTHLINNKLTKQDVAEIKTNARLYVDDVMDCLWPFSRNTAEDSVILL